MPSFYFRLEHDDGTPAVGVSRRGRHLTQRGRVYRCVDFIRVELSAVVSRLARAIPTNVAASAMSPATVPRKSPERCRRWHSPLRPLINARTPAPAQATKVVATAAGGSAP
jgi:hypothetical protein